ncbi:hypothetical protein [Flammeovirga agarivorans]|uniref:Lipoprotein n=1 Tax=Flammeovirga agarivorans TaxID=2726742 RepID=A0A7X8XUE4_9BACT|nr:hypothetical protein [Flammeovirga agarivorans]NLR90271.1 hypothetical protein [Flammeovirga agarivorans]
MTIKLLLFRTLLLSAVTFLWGCETDEESKVTACNNEYISAQFLEYRNVVRTAISDKDCELIQDESEDILDFLNENYNCLVIYLVLDENNNISNDDEAIELLEEVKLELEALEYSCDVENFPTL